MLRCTSSLLKVNKHMDPKRWKPEMHREDSKELLTIFYYLSMILYYFSWVTLPLIICYPFILSLFSCFTAPPSELAILAHTIWAPLVPALTLTEYCVKLFYLNRLKLVTGKDTFWKYKSVSKSTWSTFEHELQEHSAQNCRPVIKLIIGISVCSKWGSWQCLQLGWDHTLGWSWGFKGCCIEPVSFYYFYLYWGSGGTRPSTSFSFQTRRRNLGHSESLGCVSAWIQSFMEEIKSLLLVILQFSNQ